MRPADSSLSKGFFVTPVVFGDVRNTMRIAQKEIFGPVVSPTPSIIDVTDGSGAGSFSLEVRRGVRLTLRPVPG